MSSPRFDFSPNAPAVLRHNGRWFINGGKAGEAAQKWTIEGASPGILNRVGWKFNMIKPGDKVVMIVAPMRSGGNSALLKEITLPSGKVMNNGGFAGPALIH